MSGWDGSERRRNGRRDQDNDLMDIKEILSECLLNRRYEPVQPVRIPDQDLSHSILNVKDVITIIGLIVGGLISGFTIWINLSDKIDKNYSEFALFKSEISRASAEHDKQYEEIKKVMLNLENKVIALDNSLTQMYNLINRGKNEK